MTRMASMLVRRGLTACLAAFIAGQAQAEAGRVEFVIGSASVRDANGLRPLTRGLEVQSGDTILTTDGRAQIRFTDGAFVSLHPNTEFAIREYRFEGRSDGTESGVFGLVKGAMRTVTGLIGRVNREKYKIVTPTATVGIRGTGGLLSILSNGATLLIGTSGTWFLATNAGIMNVGPGGTGLAEDQNKPPRAASETTQSNSGSQYSWTPPISNGEQRTSSGGSTALGNAAGSPISLAYMEVLGGGGTLSPGSLTPLTSGSFSLQIFGDVSSSGQLNGYSYKETFQGSTNTFEYRFNGTHLDAGGDGGVSWGRWTGPATSVSTQANGATTTTSNVFPANGGFHYVVGPPATQMPTTGSFTYNMVGATGPTIRDASLPPGTVNSAQLTGNFTPSGGTVSLNAAFGFNATNYTMTQTGTINGTGFSGTGSVAGGTCTVCSASMQGVFFNPGATHAGVSYSANTNNSGTATVGGVITLKR